MNQTSRRWDWLWCNENNLSLEVLVDKLIPSPTKVVLFHNLEKVVKQCSCHCYQDLHGDCDNALSLASHSQSVSTCTPSLLWLAFFEWKGILLALLTVWRIEAWLQILSIDSCLHAIWLLSVDSFSLVFFCLQKTWIYFFHLTTS